MDGRRMQESSRPLGMRPSLSQASLRPAFGHRRHSPLGSGPSLRSTAKPLPPRAATFGSQSDPLLKASRSAASLSSYSAGGLGVGRQALRGSGPAVSGGGGGHTLLSGAPSPLGSPGRSSAMGFTGGASVGSGAGVGSRPTTPGGSVRALRSRLETARLTDQNITLSEDVHRLASSVAAHQRFNNRATAAAEAKAHTLAEKDKRLAALQRENEALAAKLRARSSTSTTREKKLEMMLAVARQEMASLRQRATAQEAQIRRLTAADGEEGVGVASSDGANAGTSDGGSTNGGDAGKPPIRRLSISVGLRGPGSGPLLISPMQSPAVTPRSGTSGGSASPRGDSDSTSAAAVAYELQKQLATLRARAANEARQRQAAIEDRNAEQAKALAYRKELELKDSQMATLRERISELEAAAAAGGGVGGSGDASGAGGGGDSGAGGSDSEDFEAVLREEMLSMRASFNKQLREQREAAEAERKKHERREEYWKDQMTDARQRYLALQMRFERLQRQQQPSA